MKQSRILFIYLLAQISLIQLIKSGSVPVIWEPSSFFQAGQFICDASSSGVLRQVTATYSTALSGTPPKKPSLGIADINYNFNIPRVFFRLEIASYSATALVANFTVQYNATFSMKLNYLAPDPTMTYQYSSYSYNIPYPTAKVGPFFISNTVQMAGLTASSLNMSHQNAMLPFVHFMDLNISNNCLDIAVKLRVYNGTHYEYNISSDCPGMTMSLIGWSRIIFDKTGIENLGFCFFQYGQIQGINNDDSTITTTLSPYIGQNFIMGVSQFKYNLSSTPMIMGFNSLLGNTTSVRATTFFNKLVFTYWSLKYRKCPSNYPYFVVSTYQCFDKCNDTTYYNPSLFECKSCYYTCVTCDTYPQCSGCSTVSNRYLNGTSCIPSTGYYENGTYVAPPCKTGCSACTNYDNCSSCDFSNGYFLSGTSCLFCNSSLNYFVNTSSNVCQKCNLSFCISCSSLDRCSSCNITQKYTLVNYNCDYCNQSLNYFINLSETCQKCSLVGCTICSSLSSCSVCETANNYFLTNGNTCEKCVLTGCLVCSSLSACSSCDLNSNYILNGTSCSYCNTSSGYFIYQGQCQSCSLVGCKLCSSLTTCSLCKTTDNYVLDGSICKYCNSSLNYFVNSNSLQCQKCSIQGCIQCASLDSCSTCNTSGSYYPDGSICSYCNASQNMFINTTTKLCELCAIDGCANCSSLTTCLVCTDLSKCGNKNDKLKLILYIPPPQDLSIFAIIGSSLAALACCCSLCIFGIFRYNRNQKKKKKKKLKKQKKDKKDKKAKQEKTKQTNKTQTENKQYVVVQTFETQLALQQSSIVPTCTGKKLLQTNKIEK